LKEIHENGSLKALNDARLSKISRRNIEKGSNVNGSGISLGHPIETTGAMRMTTLPEKCGDAMRVGDSTTGGGGQGISLIFEEKPQQEGLS
jgi:acetyl-CoA acetyltransferase